MSFESQKRSLGDFYRIISYLSCRVERVEIDLVLSLSISTYMTSFESVISIAIVVIFFVSRVMDDISTTSSPVSWGEIHQALLSQFSLLVAFSNIKVQVNN